MKYFENESCVFSMFVLQDRHKFILILLNWLTEKMICCFISRLFSSWVMKCYIYWSICKIAIFWNSNCYICGDMRKIATFWDSKCYILWQYANKLLLFYWKCCISWEIYKFATFSINDAKLKLFHQLFQSQFIVANILVSLDCLSLLIIFNFLGIFQKQCSVNILRCANLFVKIYNLTPFTYELQKLNPFFTL